MGVYAGPDVSEGGLVLYLDAVNAKSYPGSGTTWTDIIGGKNGTLTNGPLYYNGNISFDGLNDYVASVSNVVLGGSFSISLWVKHVNTNITQERYITLGSDRIIIQEDANANLNLYVSDGTQNNLWIWGGGNTLNNVGNLGTNSTVNKSTPVTTFAGGTNWKSISMGSASAAIKTDGTLWLWGGDGFQVAGNLGVNDLTNRSTPVTTFAGGTNWKQVSSGQSYVAAIKTDGTFWTWGRNDYGQLGNGDINGYAKLTPTTTFAGGTNWKQVSCVGYVASAIKTDGTLWNWGYNFAGQLGVNNTTDRRTPVTTFAGGTNWKQVSCGGNNIAAIKTDGTLWLWGYNSYGSLGTNDIIYRSTPVTTILGGTNWKIVSNYGASCAAIKTDGTLWTWGRNQNGQLGINNNISRSTPVTTFSGGTNWKSISYSSSMLAIKTDGTLWTWGDNTYGGLGINNTINKSTPVTTLLGGTNWKLISSSVVSAAIKTNATFINDVSASTTITKGAYANIVVTSDGTTLKLYKDSALVSTSTLNGTLSSTSLSYTLSDTFDAFKGDISVVQVYEKELSANQIAQNYIALKQRLATTSTQITTSSRTLYLDAGDTSSYSGTGTTWYDLSGNGNNATLVNSPLFVEEFEGYLDFDDGFNQYATFGGTVNNFTVGSIECFVEIRNPLDSLNQQIIARTNANTGTFNLLKNSSNKYAFSMRLSTGTQYTIASDNLADGEWVHIVGTYDGTTQKLYVDGILQAATTSISGTIDTTGTYTQNIARNTTGLEYCKMDIGVIGLYSKALTQGEVLTNFNSLRTRYNV